MPVVFDGFVWDGANREKCQRHGVSIAEIEQSLSEGSAIAPDPAHSFDEQRFIAVNRNAQGRPMFIAFTLRKLDGTTLIRPVSARYMHRKEVARYEKSSRS